MLDFGLQNKDFKHQLKLDFSKPESVQDANNITYDQSQIKGIFDNYNYGGYMDYRNTHKAINEVNQFIINRAQGENFQLAF
ncbi:MAG: hypothetical protein JEZ03_15470 [Bacteroidales bacterium]|nr:hypothetical protein [Bacteroidales bacterium]